MNNTLDLVITFVFQALAFFCIARFLLQACRVDFYNPISQGVVKVTDLFLKPLRMLLPGWGNLDFASFLAAWLAVVAQLYLQSVVAGGLFGSAFNMIAVALLNVLMLVLSVFKWSIIIMIVASWIAPSSYHPALALIQQIVEPVMAPARKLIPPLGGLDLSPMLVILLLLIIESALPQLFMSLLV